MSSIRIVSMHVTLILWCATSLLCGEREAKAQIVISSNKSSYLEGEPICIIIEFSSRSHQPQPLYLPSIHSSTLRYNLINSRGDTLKFNGYYVDVATGKRSRQPEILAGSFWTMDDLLLDFGEMESGPLRVQYLPEGRYTLQLSCMENEVVDVEGTPLVLQSNVLSFDVAKPEDDERTVREMYLDAVRNGKDDGKREETLLLDIVTQHPHSAYIGRAFCYLLSYYHVEVNDSAKYDKFVRMFLNNYPDCPYTYYYYGAYLRSAKTPEEKLRVLDSLARSHPGTFEERDAKHQIEFTKYHLSKGERY